MYGPSPIDPYPLEAFHLIIDDAAREICINVKAPEAMVGMSMLATMSAACQGLIDVELPSGQVCPVSLFLLLVANSGDRKTSVDNIASSPLYALDERWSQTYEAAMVAYKAQHAAWTAIAIGIRRKLAKAAQDELPLDELKHEQALHLANEPVKPRRRRITRNGMSERALMEAMAGDGESIVFRSDEGDTLLKGGLTRQLGLLNSAWSGAREISRDWGHGESLVCRNPRAVISLMLQEQVLREHMERHGDRWRGSGHLARYLVAAPASLQGSRYVYTLDQFWRFVPVFHERIGELLEEYRVGIEAGPINRQVLEFSDEARKQWADNINELESTLGPWGGLRDVPDAASKAMEMVGRIAGLLHKVSGQEGRISVDTFQRALKVVVWHLAEFKRIFAPPTVPLEFMDAENLMQYLNQRFFSFGGNPVPKNLVLRNGPVRPVQRMRAALDVLMAHGRVHLERDSAKRYWIKNGPAPTYLQQGFANV